MIIDKIVFSKKEPSKYCLWIKPTKEGNIPMIFDGTWIPLTSEFIIDLRRYYYTKEQVYTKSEIDAFLALKEDKEVPVPATELAITLNIDTAKNRIYGVASMEEGEDYSAFLEEKVTMVLQGYTATPETESGWSPIPGDFISLDTTIAELINPSGIFYGEIDLISGEEILLKTLYAIADANCQNTKVTVQYQLPPWEFEENPVIIEEDPTEPIAGDMMINITFDPYITPGKIILTADNDNASRIYTDNTATITYKIGEATYTVTDTLGNFLEGVSVGEEIDETTGKYIPYSDYVDIYSINIEGEHPHILYNIVLVAREIPEPNN